MHPRPTVLALPFAFALADCGASPTVVRDVATGQTQPRCIAVNTTDVWFVGQDAATLPPAYDRARLADQRAIVHARDGLRSRVYPLGYSDQATRP